MNGSRYSHSEFLVNRLLMWLFSTHFFWLNCVLRLRLPQELLQICVIMSVPTHTLHGWSSSTLLCMIWRLIVPLMKLFIPSTTSLRIAGFKLWHQMMILIDHLHVRRVELNWHTKIRAKQCGCWSDTRVKTRNKLKPDGIWMQITMYWPANREVSQNYWTGWHPRAGTNLIFLSWTINWDRDLGNITWKDHQCQAVCFVRLWKTWIEKSTHQNISFSFHLL